MLCYVIGTQSRHTVKQQSQSPLCRHTISSRTPTRLLRCFRARRRDGGGLISPLDVASFSHGTLSAPDSPPHSHVTYANLSRLHDQINSMIVFSVRLINYTSLPAATQTTKQQCILPSCFRRRRKNGFASECSCSCIPGALKIATKDDKDKAIDWDTFCDKNNRAKMGSKLHGIKRVTSKEVKGEA